MILKATVNDQATEVADMSNKQRIEHFILLIILLCIQCSYNVHAALYAFYFFFILSKKLTCNYL